MPPAVHPTIVPRTPPPAPAHLDRLRVRPLRADEIRPLAEAVDEISEAQLANRWQEQETGYRELLVAELDGEAVGTVSISVTGSGGRSMHLFALEVANGQRNRGVGAALVRYVVDEACRRDCRSVYLEVRSDNPARRLYHRLGFRRVGPPFVNTWYRFNEDGSRSRVEELSYRMVKRVRGEC